MSTTATRNAAAAKTLIAALTPARNDLRDTLNSIGQAWREEVRAQIHPNLRQQVSWHMDSDTTGHLELSAIAFFQDHGTKPHRIAAKNGSHLHFYWEKKGRWAHPREVRHPGQKPKHFVSEAFYSYRVNRALALAPTNVTIRTGP